MAEHNPFEGYRAVNIRIAKPINRSKASMYWSNTLSAHIPLATDLLNLERGTIAGSLTTEGFHRLVIALYMTELQKISWAAVGEKCLIPGYFFKSNAFSDFEVSFQMEKIDG